MGSDRYTSVNVPPSCDLAISKNGSDFPKKSFLSSLVADSSMCMVNLESCTSSALMVMLPREAPVHNKCISKDVYL